MAAEAPAPGSLADELGRALRAYLEGAGEAALARAYELGRNAAATGLGLLDVVLLHHATLARLLPAPAGRPLVDMAGQFLAECLSPFEMALRSYQDNARLLGLSQTLAQENAEMAHARAQLQTILDATTAVIYLRDAAGRFLFVNQQFERAFGVPRGAALGRTAEELLPPDTAAALIDGDRAALAARSPRELEETLPAADGPHTYISLKFPLLDRDDAPYALCCVATDITERKRSAEAERRAQEAAIRERHLEEAIRRRDEFLTVATHELSTPLTTLLLQVGSLARAIEAEPAPTPLLAKAAARCESISRQVDRLKRTVENLIEVGTVSLGDLQPARERLDLAALVQQVLSRCAPQIRASGCAVTVHGAARAEGAWDRRRLEGTVSALLQNALKFGQGKPVELRLGLEGGGASLAVRDHGIGMAPEDQERIFQRFGRAVSERHYGGFGVSLWLARQVAEAHGGRIRVWSAPGAGAEFTLELPVSQDDARAAPAAAAAQRSPAP